MVIVHAYADLTSFLSYVNIYVYLFTYMHSNRLLTLLREKDILTLETVMSMSDVSTGNSLNAITDTDTPPPDTFSRTTNVHEWTTKLIESKQIALKFLQQDILVVR